uniref:Phosphoglycolate phosphatase n=1 Tax=Candidatus Kentrum sp. FM TaxID=2126340 RepID=A0A450T732_9GAMM|nr:MAG: phosphoglycolate phosphatase [Candidatus Kentron sp. FM]VFJ64686.1 MAG: phosphoglycolate phosphatase [Candidatus Kentron sp. FM]VFK14493.1 MAG: phosphoglycolate phosphatase [Candidatus Kentron sp. FM]
MNQVIPTLLEPARINNPKLVVFDLDGTLVDSVPDIAISADEMLIRLGMAPYGEARIRQCIGYGGLQNLVERLLTQEMHTEPDAELFDKAYSQFLDIYERQNGEKSTLYSGALAVLDYLAAEGIPLACITNKAARFTGALLEKLGIRHRFAIVLSGDSLPKKKPDPMPLFHVANYLGVDAAESVLIGDSILDIKAARAAGFYMIAVSHGYNDGLDICKAESKPDVVIDSLAELAGVLGIDSNYLSTL